MGTKWTTIRIGGMLSKGISFPGRMPSSEIVDRYAEHLREEIAALLEAHKRLEKGNYTIRYGTLHGAEILVKNGSAYSGPVGANDRGSESEASP